VYYSRTGNTKKVADAIASQLPGEVITGTVKEEPAIADCDVVFLGMPVDRFGAPPCIEPYVKKHLVGRQVALFVTHAAHEDEPELQPCLERCRQAAATADIVGFFDCQGELDPKTARIMMLIPGLRKFAKKQPETVGQPDAARLQAAREFGHRIAEKFEVALAWA
jgi:flavodoxin